MPSPRLLHGQSWTAALACCLAASCWTTATAGDLRPVADANPESGYALPPAAQDATSPGTIAFSEAADCDVDGGGIALPDGSTDATIVVDDVADPLDVVRDGTATGPSAAWVITDGAGVILGLPAAPPFDLNGAGIGTCLIWYVRFEGEVGNLAPGNNASELTGCFDLSNPITVDRVGASAGGVATGQVAMPSGATTRYVCPGDDGPITVELQYETPAGQVAYAITDEGFDILAISMDNGIDLSGAGVGTCYIWAYNYTGEIVAAPGESVFGRFSDGEFLISENAVRAVREAPEAGTVATPEGETTVYTCVDGTPDFVGFRAAGASGANFAFVITDADNTILGINRQGFADFDGAGVGDCRVWGLSYTGTLTAGPGDDAAAVALSDRCFDLSDDFITVVRAQPDGGTVLTDAGDERVVLDGDDRALAFGNTSASGAPYGYFVTDEAGVIVGVTLDETYDFAGLPDGEYFVWGVSHTGTVLLAAGDRFYGSRPAEGCFDFSANAIVVTVGPDPFGFTATPVSEDVVMLRGIAPEADAYTGQPERARDKRLDEPAGALVSIRVTTSGGRPVASVDDLPAEALDRYLLDVGPGGGGVYFVTVVRGETVTTERVVMP